MIRASKREIEETLREMEEKYGIGEGILSEIYDEESRVVFMGVRRNIKKNVRKIVHPDHVNFIITKLVTEEEE
jgi:hypothetical protein